MKFTFMGCTKYAIFIYNNFTYIILIYYSIKYSIYIFTKGVSHYKYFRQLVGYILTLKRFSIKLTKMLVLKC